MSTSPPTQSPFRQPKAVWAVAFACVISFMGIGLVDPILPALAEQLQASPSQVSLLFTSYLLITAVMMLVTGWVSSRIGAKPTLLIGLAIIVVFAALAGVSGSIGEIVGFRAGWGLGNALFIATSLAVIVASASGGFAGAIVLYETALGVGIALGPLVGGLLGSVSWRLPFFGVAVLMAIALVATLVLLDRTPKPAKKISLVAPIAALRHRGLATIAAAAFAYNWGFFTLLAYSPYSMDLDALGLGLVFTGWGLMVAIFAVLAAPALERRFGTVRVLYVNLALMAVDLAVIGLGNASPLAVIIAVVVAGAFIGLNNTLVTQAVMSVSPVDRPVASASYSFVRFLGGGLAPFVAGLIADAFFPAMPFYVAAVIVALGIVVLATAHRLLRSVERGEYDPMAPTGPTTEPAGSGADAPAPAVAAARHDGPVLVAVDDLVGADGVLEVAGRLAAAAAAPVLLVHVAEDVMVGDGVASEPLPDDPAVRRALGTLRAQGAEASARTLPPVADHDAVGPAIARLAAGVDARAVVVGRPHRGPLAALARPSADRALLELGPCPVVVVPPSPGGEPEGGDTTPAPAGAPAVEVDGRVLDEAGAPVAAVLTLMDASGRELDRTETDAGGRYGLRATTAEPGSGLVVARAHDGAAGHASPAVSPVALPGRIVHDVVLGSGSRPVGV